MNIKINPQKLIGPWNEGWALDLHTIRSIPIAPEIKLFDTEQTPIAEELYLLKYRNERPRAENIAIAASKFLTSKMINWSLDVIIPIPPSV